MVRPDYERGSIVNLMSSLLKGMGGEPLYRPLPDLDEKRLFGSKNVVLLILDGIGYRYVKRKGKNTVLHDNLHSKITSVYPSSTASAIPTFYTGLAPQQHGVTGWYTLIKELGVVSTILPFQPRFGDKSLSEFDIEIESVLSSESLMNQISRKCYNVTMDKLKDSQFNSFYERGFEHCSYSSLKGLFQVLEHLLMPQEEKKFIRAYWNGFDTVAHDEGVNSASASRLFFDLDDLLKKFVENVKGTDSTLIVTSDHGFIDSEKERAIKLEEHPELQKCLSLPLCGDHRTVFCYVHPSRSDRFEEYWEDHLMDFCELHKSEELIEKDYFGLFEANSQLYHRIGDYTLIMKENYVFRDELKNEEGKFMVGNHGGTSEDEMYVPLCVLEL